ARSATASTTSSVFPSTTAAMSRATTATPRPSRASSSPATPAAASRSSCGRSPRDVPARPPSTASPRARPSFRRPCARPTAASASERQLLPAPTDHPLHTEGIMRRAKIVATLGPATSSYENLRAIIDAGVNAARMNLSHGSYAVHEEVYANVRRAAADADQPVAVLVDLQGPKIRLGKFADGPHDLAVGDIFTITTEDVEGTKNVCGTTFAGLPNDVKPGDFLLIDDGKVKVRVLDTDGVRVRTEVIVAGPVSNNKGINLPGVAVNVPALSEKDEDDLRWGLGLGADYIALSFVRDARAITRVHEIMAEEGRKVPVIAKIEKPQAVDALEEIIDAFDGIMV